MDVDNTSNRTGSTFYMDVFGVDWLDMLHFCVYENMEKSWQVPIQQLVFYFMDERCSCHYPLAMSYRLNSEDHMMAAAVK